MRRKGGIAGVLEGWGDAALNLISLLLSLRITRSVFGASAVVSGSEALLLLVLFALISSVIYQLFDLYRPIPYVRSSRVLYDILPACGVSYGILFLTFVLFFREVPTLFALVTASFGCLFSGVAVIAKKRLIIALVRLLRRRRGAPRRVLLATDAPGVASAFIREFERESHGGIEIIGAVSDCEEQEISCRRLAGFSDFSSVLDAEKVDFTVFCMDGYGGDRVQRMVRACDDRCVKVFLVPSAQGFFKSQEQIEYIGSLPIINIHSTPLDVPKNAALKRAMDIVCSLVLIIVFSPVMISVALGVLVSLGRPIFFKQERVGLMGKPFGMIKFRSMRPGRGTSGGWSTGVDSRKTRFGNLIRRYSLDELPQLFNVLAGSMSLVGPRPEQREFVERFKDEIPLYMVKHYVKPGMTGLAQIKGLRGDTSISERISADISYIEGWSLLLDIQILLKTPFRMLNRSEVYTKGSGENEK